jgi:hypothetical protein
MMFLAYHGLASEAALHGWRPLRERCPPLHILNQLHEAEVHVQLLVTVEQS